MDKDQFHNAIKQQDLHILEVSDSPPGVLEKTARDSQFVDFVFARVHSDRYNTSAYVAYGSPVELDSQAATLGMAKQIAAYFMREVARLETERAMSETNV